MPKTLCYIFFVYVICKKAKKHKKNKSTTKYTTRLLLKERSFCWKTNITFIVMPLRTYLLTCTFTFFHPSIAMCNYYSGLITNAGCHTIVTVP